MTTNTERCGGEVEAWVAMVEAEPHDFTAQERIAAGRMRKLFYALAEERAKGERLVEALKPLAAIADHYDDREDSGLMLFVDFDALEPPLLLLHARDARAALASP